MVSSSTLKQYHELPAHLRTNQFLRGHYRPPTDWKGCVKSVGYVHNETVNIVTHVIPALFIVLFLPWLLPWSSLTNVHILPYTHVLSCLAPWVGSVIYHVFLNHKSGKPTYDALLYFDLFGIWVAQAVGSIVPLAAATFCYSPPARISFWALYLSACGFSLKQALTATTIWERRLCFLPAFFFRVAVVLLRLNGLATGHPESLQLLINQDLIALTAALIGALKLPERLLPPGALDLLGHSHQWMHVLVVWAAWLIHRAVERDLIWISEKQC